VQNQVAAIDKFIARPFDREVAICRLWIDRFAVRCSEVQFVNSDLQFRLAVARWLFDVARVRRTISREAFAAAARELMLARCETPKGVYYGLRPKRVFKWRRPETL